VKPRDQTRQGQAGHGFGTAPVFLASICTILGAILFLRLGYAVGNTGLLGTLGIIVVGHLVTIPTALAIAEIATNRRVEGGGEYFIISRSFGGAIGGAIGIPLYLSQTVSIAFYMIAFAEALRPLAPWFEATVGVPFDPHFVSLPAALLLLALVLTKGAALGVRALWVVAVVLGLSLLAFLFGGPVDGAAPTELSAVAARPDPFILVFAIVFPGFTGMTAGVGLSGDLAKPGRSIPLGVLSATLFGMLVYALAAYKLAASASPEALAEDQLIMARIALWGPAIPIGLACAAISSAIGSVLIAPRTLQAMAADEFSPVAKLDRLLAKGVGEENEPRNATILTGAIVLVTVAAGDVDSVARMISMFFMVTYGALCSISALEHFAARPGYRPSFRSRWYISLFGALMCLFLMFQMDPVSAIVALALMFGIYWFLNATRDNDLAAIFQGALQQATRLAQIKLQGTPRLSESEWWRPSVIALSDRTFTHVAPFRFLGWLGYRYGFGTYLHYVKGRLDRQTHRECQELQSRLLEHTRSNDAGIYMDTIISPSKTSALAQALQLPGVSGLENNTALFELVSDDLDEAEGATDEVRDLTSGLALAFSTRTNSLVLRHTKRFFGKHQSIHVWLTWHDERNAALMILLAYVIIGHPEWKRAEIEIYAAVPYSEVGEEHAKLLDMVESGRLPIAKNKIEIIGTSDKVNFDELVRRRSSLADLVIFGFTEDRFRDKGASLFQRHPELGDVLFVCAREQILIR
jgi:solute carrier family 12 sodium/potassium/chloride transporter 2